MRISNLIKREKHNKSQRFARSTFGNIICFIFILAGGLFCMIPLLYAVISSFKPLDELMVFPPRFFVQRPTIVNYVALPDLLSNLDVPLSRYVLNSIFICVITPTVYILISSMAAFSLSKGKYRGKKSIFWVVQLALMFNTYTLSVPQYLIQTKLHIINTYLTYILPYMASTLGVFLIKQYIEGYVPDAYLEAARIDGASYYRIFLAIVMPIIRPVLMTLILFSFREIWSMVPNGTIFTEELKTLPQVVSQITAGGMARAGSAMALTSIMMIPPIIIYLVTQRSVVQSMTSAGIKE